MSPSLSAWIGPAVVAAVISALIQMIGWRIADRRDLKADQRRRAERVRDIQTALRAEIRSFLAVAGPSDVEERKRSGSALSGRIRQAPDDAPFTPFVPRSSQFAVFSALSRDVSVLPVAVIDPVVLFYRQTVVLADLVEDLRSERFTALDKNRKAVLFDDYVAIEAEAVALAGAAVAILDRSLGEGWLQ